MEWTRGDYQMTDDKTRFDLKAICDLLHTTYWAIDRPNAVIAKSIENSICLGLFHGDKQIGFCRGVTDFATFTWICDVIIDPRHRGNGMGKWMVEILLAHPQLQTRSQLLATADAHTLYTRHGFAIPEQDYLKRVLPFPGDMPNATSVLKPGEEM